MDINKFIDFANNDIPMNLVKEVKGLEIEPTTDSRFVWRCTQYSSEPFDSPLGALIDFLNESAKIWNS